MPSIRSTTERRLFQLAVCIAAVVPILAGGTGALLGPAMIHRELAGNSELESHFRYLSGVLFGMGIAFVFAAFDIERRAAVFRTLGLIVVAGGLARLLQAIRFGFPDGPHRFALVMELAVVPALLLWLRRVERLTGL